MMAPRNILRTASATAAACAVCAGVAFAAPASASVSGPQALIDTGIVVDATNPGNTKDWFAGVPEGTIMVVTPGTDDTGLFPRINGLVGTRQTLIVQHPEAFGPIIAGKSGKFPLFAPSYDKSKQVAIDNNLAAMRVLSGDGDVPFVIWTGYSQGSDALGNAAEIGYAEGLLDENDMIVLVSDPRSPWGIKAFASRVPLLPYLLGAVGIENDGARDPGKTGDLNVVSIIVKGDPVSNFQWVWYRPISSLAVNVAGFIAIHSNQGSQDFENIDELGTPQTLLSEDGQTVYMVYDAYHPFAQVRELFYKTVSLEYTQEDLEQWDAGADKFYPIQGPSVGSSAVPVYDPLAPSSPQTSYAVTTPSEVATGEVPFVPAGTSDDIPEQPALENIEAPPAPADETEVTDESQPTTESGTESVPISTPKTEVPTGTEETASTQSQEPVSGDSPADDEPESSSGWFLPEDVDSSSSEPTTAAA